MNCSRYPSCKNLAIVKRWFYAGQFPILIAYLCSECKDLPLWSVDVSKEEKLGGQNVV